MKQTAVEWFFKYLDGVRIIDGYEYIKLKEAFEQAKEMEKEQIIDAFDEGFTDGCRYTTGFEQTIWQEGELYYNETFKPE